MNRKERSLAPEVTQTTVLDAVHIVDGLGWPSPQDADVRYFLEIEERIAEDLMGYVRWIQNLGSERLQREASLRVLHHALKNVARLWRDEGLGGYACGEAMQICLSDLVILEELEDTEIPLNVVRRLQADLLPASLDLVARLIRNVSKRRRIVVEPVPKAGDPNVRALSELLEHESDAAPVARHGKQPILVVATAGRGTRLRTTIPKGLVPIGGIPMVQRVVKAAQGAGAQEVIFALRYRADVQVDYLTRYGAVLVQRRAEGTGYTVMHALSALPDRQAPILVSFSDTPFLTSDSFERALAELDASGADLVVSTFPTSGSEEIGRVLRGADGGVVAIGQPRHGSVMSPEGDGGLYALKRQPVLKALGRTINANIRYEYDLPGVVQELLANGRRVSTTLGSADEYEGVNRPGDLLLARLRAATGVAIGSIWHSEDARRAAISFFMAYGGEAYAEDEVVQAQAVPPKPDPNTALAAYIERAGSLVGPVLDLRAAPRAT